MFLSKVFAEAKEDATVMFAAALLAAILIASIGLVAVYFASNSFFTGFEVFVISLVIVFSLAFCGPAKPIGEDFIAEIWWKSFASIFIMALLLFGFGLGLWHGLYSPLETYWPYALGAIIVAEEVLYWLDNSQVGDIIPLTTNKYTFTVQKKLEAFFEILLFFGAVGIVDATPAVFSELVTILSDAAIIIGAIVLIAIFIWVNSLKWKTPKQAYLPKGDNADGKDSGYNPTR